jgi:hypothetical protein
MNAKQRRKAKRAYERSLNFSTPTSAEEYNKRMARMSFNSDYRAHVTPTTRLYDPKLAEAVTATARKHQDSLTHALTNQE